MSNLVRSLEIRSDDTTAPGVPNRIGHGATGRALFAASWERVLMIHFAVRADALQRDVPFPLDLLDGEAFVTLVLFTMSRFRPAFGGRLTAWLTAPMATHEFFNVRTYVRVADEIGIHFLAEWVSNRLATALGPLTFSLPYRHGRFARRDAANDLSGSVTDAETGREFAYRAKLLEAHSQIPRGTVSNRTAALSTCEVGSPTHWLMERYTAFNSAGGRQRFFRVWHEPWRQCSAEVSITNSALVERHWSWFSDAHFIGANYSPGVREVRLGWPCRIRSRALNPVKPPSSRRRIREHGAQPAAR